MFQQPFLAQAVYQIVVTAVKRLLPPEKHVKTLTFPLVTGVLIAPAELFNPFLPGEAAGYGGIAVEKMIGHDDAGIAHLFIEMDILRTFGVGARARLEGVEVGFV
jgi:hypothetical protein